MVRCYAVIAPRDTFGIRVNNILGFCNANKKICSLLENAVKTDNKFISPTAIINSTQFSNSSVGDGTVISEKTSIKNTTFGSHCKINQKTRIADCIFMNSVIVEEKLVLK